MRLVIGLALGSLLAAGPGLAAEPAPAKRPADPDRLICKRSVETGSLVARVKACHTRKDWDRIADSQQSGARKVVEGLMTRPCGGDFCRIGP